MARFPLIIQLDFADCGPTCLGMIAKYYGKIYSSETLRKLTHMNRAGVSFGELEDAATLIGMENSTLLLTFDELARKVHLPCIVYWRQRHFIVVYKIKKDKVHIADPVGGLVVARKKEFLQHWISTREDGRDQGICLELTPTPEFYRREDDKSKKSKGFGLLRYLKPYRPLINQLLLAMLLTNIFQVLLPFLTQSVVDVAINQSDMQFVYLVLIAQLVITVSQYGVDIIQSRILLHVTSRVSITVISDFLIKLLRMPIVYFDAKFNTDILQRIHDHKLIQDFLSQHLLKLVFGLMNLVLFSLILGFYSRTILLIFLLGTSFYLGWTALFLHKSRILNFRRYIEVVDTMKKQLQIITGMQEIKLANSEIQTRWDWQATRARLFKVDVDMKLNENYQQFGAQFFHQLKNLVISFYAASCVIRGEMTLGMMLAVQYIIGILNAPFEQMVQFIRSSQAARMSMERLAEIHQRQDEKTRDKGGITTLPEDKTIIIDHLSFRYEGPGSELVLKDIDLTIPQNKVTAIVGVSGSGKTTLIKLLLGFYQPAAGLISVGDTPLNHINQRFWRDSCGVVFQDGFIFSDSITNNIAVSDGGADRPRLYQAIRIANVQEIIETRFDGLQSQIGMEGAGLSQGQKQRILIARSIYKNPRYLFFDEATNSLDANNERMIVENLQSFYENRTVILVAHRLSTVKNAHQIIVLDKGRVVELGAHDQLVSLRGHYYTLIKNQLELGA